jgi:hypothetical protein
MMGLEPTTFCMANGSLVEPQTPSEATSANGNGGPLPLSQLVRKYRDLRSIPWGLGTRTALVPIRRGFGFIWRRELTPVIEHDPAALA